MYRNKFYNLFYLKNGFHYGFEDIISPESCFWIFSPLVTKFPLQISVQWDEFVKRASNLVTKIFMNSGLPDLSPN